MFGSVNLWSWASSIRCHPFCLYSGEAQGDLWVVERKERLHLTRRQWGLRGRRVGAGGAAAGSDGWSDF